MIIRYKYRTVFVIFFLLFFTFQPNAQKKYYSKSKKAIKKFEAAKHQYHLKYYDLAKAEIEKALHADEKFLDAYILLGEIANEENDKLKAVDYYTKAISIEPEYNPLMYIRRADLQKETGKYAEAKRDFQKFLSFEKKPIDYIRYVNEKLIQCEFAIELKKQPVSFVPYNLGPEINSPISEYWPSITADDNTITFTVSNRLQNSQEDLYFSIKSNGKWLNANKIEAPVNTKRSEGAQTISADGKTMVFTACLRPDGYGSCDLYISKKIGAKWTKPLNIGAPINGRYKETQPSLSSDGKTIYYVSNMPGGKGKFDIWKSTINTNGKWGRPVNLGDSINTKEDELAPFIHYDNQTLYFSSEGHSGMGGSDLFLSKKKSNLEWSKAKNLGYPINTHFNEESLVINSSGEMGLFSSNMEGGHGQKDIYQFQIPPEIKPGKIIFIKGLVYDEKTNIPLHSQIEISQIDNEDYMLTESDKKNGEFLACLTPNNSYAFNINKTGYMIYSANFELSDSSIYIKIPLKPIKIGESAILKNIFFEFDSFELKKESFVELKKLISFINKNNLSIEIQGHTDNTGTPIYNQKLSSNRAKSVYEYLLKNEVNKKNLSYKGYGFTMPIANNLTKKGKALNRRTAFKIMAKE